MLSYAELSCVVLCCTALWPHCIPATLLLNISNRTTTLDTVIPYAKTVMIMSLKSYVRKPSPSTTEWNYTGLPIFKVFSPRALHARFAFRVEQSVYDKRLPWLMTSSSLSTALALCCQWKTGPSRLCCLMRCHVLSVSRRVAQERASVRRSARLMCIIWILIYSNNESYFDIHELIIRIRASRNITFHYYSYFLCDIYHV